MASARPRTPSQRSSMLKFNPPRMMCRWLSMRPGSTRRPLRSIIRVSGPEDRITSLSRPTAVKRPAVTATAVAKGFERSSVVKRPFLRIRSAVIFAPRSRLCRAASLAGMRSQHGCGVDQPKPIGATECPRHTGRCLISLGARPIALQLEQVLQRGHRSGSCLHHPLDRTLVRLLGHIAASVGNDINLKALVDGRQRWPDDAYGGPKACESDPRLADAIDFFDYCFVFPTVHGCAVDERCFGQGSFDLVEHGTGESLFGYRRRNRRDIEYSCRIGEESCIIAQHDCIDRLRGKRHL